MEGIGGQYAAVGMHDGEADPLQTVGIAAADHVQLPAVGQPPQLELVTAAPVAKQAVVGAKLQADYDQNQYLPLVITGADNDQFVMPSLRPGNVHAALGADDDLAYFVARLRQVWPGVVLHFRSDCAFGVPDMYEVCEGLSVSYTFDLSANAVLHRETEGLLAEAVAGYKRDRQQGPPQSPMPSRLFTGFWYQAGTWSQPCWVAAKAEANDRGTNRRFVVANRPGAVALPGPTYDAYAARGESENRHKEFKCDLAMDRLSDHRFLANYFRLYLHAAALNLLVRRRRFIAEPLPVLAPQADVTAPAATWSTSRSALRTRQWSRASVSYCAQGPRRGTPLRAGYRPGPAGQGSWGA
jgi:hypothetical protein